MNKRLFLLILHCISLILLGFGWVLDMLRINISMHYLVDISIFDEKRSVLGTLQSLWQSSNYFPFGLIALFGILVPVLKSVGIFIILLQKKHIGKLPHFLAIINKWAMADVFVMSIFVAFLGAKAMDFTSANLEPGFYYFSAYVLLSAIVTALLSKFVAKQ